MDVIIYGIILTGIAILATWFIRKSKREGWDKKITEEIDKYELLLTMMGTIVKDIDEKLYAEMNGVLIYLEDMYSKDTVTKADVEQCLKEVQDVFTRAAEVYEKYRKQLE